VRKAIGATRHQLSNQFLAEAIVVSLIAIVVGMGLAEAVLPTLGGTYPWGVTNGVTTTDVFSQMQVYAGSMPAAMHTGLGRATRITVYREKLEDIILPSSALTAEVQAVFRPNRSTAESVHGPVGSASLVLLVPKGKRVTVIKGKQVRAYDLQGSISFIESTCEEVADIEGDVELFDSALETARNICGKLYQRYYRYLGMRMDDYKARRLEAEDCQLEDIRGGVDIDVSNAQLKAARLGGRVRIYNPPTVIGIAPDFHFRSFREPIKPALFHYGPEASFKRALVRLNTYKVDDSLAGLEQVWEKVAPEQPFEYEFLDRAFARQYESDEESSRTVTFASVVAILIACMGLFGHATIVLQRRTKEIGVRKVLGATVAEILALLSRDLAKMVALACLLAFPLAHFLVGQWLSRYAYQFGLGLTTYLLCGTIAFAIALGTVAYIGVRAARENPVKALRYE
jgi:hypothetical protein